MKITINPKIDNRVKFKDVNPGETFTTPKDGGVFLKVHGIENVAGVPTNAVILLPLEKRHAAVAFTHTFFGPDSLVIVVPSELRLGVEPERTVNVDINDVTEGHNLWTSLTGDPLDAIGQPGESYEKDKSIKR